MRVAGRDENHQARVGSLVEALMEPLGRRQRAEVGRLLLATAGLPWVAGVGGRAVAYGGDADGAVVV